MSVRCWPIGRALVGLSFAALLAGCAAQRLQSGADDAMRAADYERALSQYDEALKKHPSDAGLRAAATRARSEAVVRLVATAVSLRSSNRLDDADIVIKRALAMDPGSERARAVQLDVERDRRTSAAIAGVNEMIAKGQGDQALGKVESALRENPRHPELVALQRRIAHEQRRDAEQALRLAETRPISLQFRDANLKMVLEAFSRNTQINFVLDRDVRPELRVTVFLRNARLEDAIDVVVNTNQLAKKVLDPATVLIYPNTPEKQKEYQDLVVRVFYLANAEAKQTAAMLRSVFKLREVFVDDKLNFLVIREPAETVRLAERLIALHDVSDAEVLLEVEVLEVQRSRLLELGVRFPDTFSLAPLSVGGSATGLTLEDLKNLNSSRIAVGVPPVVINLRREVGDASVLANPRIRARNREKARVMIGDRVPVVTSTATSTGFVSENVQYLDVGLKLEVEPQVYLGDDIAIRVALEVSSLTREITTRSGSLAYQIGTRNASTTLRLRDGETQLLAGLISSEDRSTSSRVPGLGDLPILGRLFSSQLDNNNRSEIVLSITPRLVRSAIRPELAEMEFWSGTEAALRSRPNPGSAQATKPVPSAEAVSIKGPSLGTVAGSLATSTAETALPAPRITLTAPRSVATGSSFVLSVVLNSQRPVRGAPIQLSYDRERLQVESVEEGGFFRQGDAGISFSHQAPPGTGLLQAAVLRVGGDGARGSDGMVTVTFKAVAAGAAKIAVTEANLIAAGDALPPAELPAPITIEVK